MGACIYLNLGLQARRALKTMHFRPKLLGENIQLVVIVDDLGNAGFPALAPTLNDTITFSFHVKPSNVPPTADFINVCQPSRCLSSVSFSFARLQLSGILCFKHNHVHVLDVRAQAAFPKCD